MLNKSEATTKVINFMKNLSDDLNMDDESVIEFRKSLFIIKQDFYMKLIELKAEYNRKEFEDC